MAEYEGYCVKEKQKRMMKDVEIVTNERGQKFAKGVCSVCGTKMTRILPKG